MRTRPISRDNLDLKLVWAAIFVICAVQVPDWPRRIQIAILFGIIAGVAYLMILGLRRLQIYNARKDRIRRDSGAG
jgi:hypothetical protein